MSASPSSLPALFLVAPRSADPVRARVALNEPQLAMQTPFLTQPGGNGAAVRGLHLLDATTAIRRRGPHPWDILYWAACLGGACLLLFCSTT